MAFGALPVKTLKRNIIVGGFLFDIFDLGHRRPFLRTLFLSDLLLVYKTAGIVLYFIGRARKNLGNLLK